MAAQALVQATSVAVASGSATSALAYTSAVQRNSLLVAVIMQSGAGKTMTLADTLGTKFQSSTVSGSTGPGATFYLFWGFAPAAGANTMTMTFGTTTGGSDYYIGEISNVPAGIQLDNAQVYSTATATTTLPNPTNTVHGDYGILFNQVISNTSATQGGAPWATMGTPQGGNPCAYILNATPGLYTPNDTQTSATYSAATWSLSVPRRGRLLSQAVQRSAVR